MRVTLSNTGFDFRYGPQIYRILPFMLRATLKSNFNQINTYHFQDNCIHHQKIHLPSS